MGLKIWLENIVFLNSPFHELFLKTKYFAGTFLKIIIFCSDYFSTKWVRYHVTRVQIITKVRSGIKTKMKHICMDQKQQLFFSETKIKTKHICKEKKYFSLKYVLPIFSPWLTQLLTKYFILY